MTSDASPDLSPMGSQRSRDLLAIEPELGSIFACNRCERIHMQLGDLHLGMTMAGFQSLVVLLNRAAANFELWAEMRSAS